MKQSIIITKEFLSNILLSLVRIHNRHLVLFVVFYMQSGYLQISFITILSYLQLNTCFMFLLFISISISLSLCTLSLILLSQFAKSMNIASSVFNNLIDSPLISSRSPSSICLSLLQSLSSSYINEEQLCRLHKKRYYIILISGSEISKR